MDSVWIHAAIGALLLQGVIRVIFGRKVLRPMLKRGELTTEPRPWRFLALVVGSSAAGPGLIAVVIGAVAGLLTWSLSTLLATVIAAMVIIPAAASAWMTVCIIHELRQTRQSRCDAPAGEMLRK